MNSDLIRQYSAFSFQQVYLVPVNYLQNNMNKFKLLCFHFVAFHFPLQAARDVSSNCFHGSRGYISFLS